MPRMPRMSGGRTTAKDPVKTFKRVVSIVFGEHKRKFAFIVFCIIVSAFSIVYSSAFLGAFIDDYVIPIIGVTDPDWEPVVMALVRFGLIVSVSVIFNYVLSRTKVTMSQ